MNPVGHGIAKALRNRRRCPHCRKEQVVAAEKRDRAVACKYCGKPIPAPRRR